jgi:hypothetical protein
VALRELFGHLEFDFQQRLPQSLALCIYAQRSTATAGEHALEDEVEGSEIRQLESGYTSCSHRPEEFRHARGGQVLEHHGVTLLRLRNDADVGARTLIATAGVCDFPEADFSQFHCLLPCPSYLHDFDPGSD